MMNLLAHAAHEGEGLSVHGPDIALRAKAAESVSLALHELTTNAVKHGALAQRNGGRIGISWRLDGSRNGRELRFEWDEKHANGPNGNPERHGFGMELLTRILPYDLGANTSVEFNDVGLTFQMDLPGDHLAEPSEKRRK